MNRREFIKAASVMTISLMLDGNLTEAKLKMKISAVKLFDGGFIKRGVKPLALEPLALAMGI